MPPKLDELEFRTGEGLWRTSYIGEPAKDDDRNRWVYLIRFKWVDPNNPENKETPQHRLSLEIFEEQMIYDDSEQRLRYAIQRWID